MTYFLCYKSIIVKEGHPHIFTVRVQVQPTREICWAALYPNRNSWHQISSAPNPLALPPHWAGNYRKGSTENNKLLMIPNN